MAFIDAEYLLRQDPRLAQVGRALTWNQFGTKIARAYHPPRPITRLDNDDTDTSGPAAEAPQWQRGKQLVHAVLMSRDPYFTSIRERLGDLENLSTPAMRFTLSLWLAGQLGLTVSATQPMVAVMLLAVAKAGGNWEILRDASSLEQGVDSHGRFSEELGQ